MAERKLVWDSVQSSSTVDDLSEGAASYGSYNTVTNSIRARVFGTLNTVTDSTWGTIVGDQHTMTNSPECAIFGGRNYSLINSTYKSTVMPNDYVVTTGSIRSDASAVGGTPVYQQFPTVTSVPSSDNDVNTRPIPGGAITFCSSDNKFYTKGAASTWHDVFTSFNPPTLSATLTAGNSTLASDIVVSSPQSVTFGGGVKIGGNGSSPALFDATSVNIGANTINAASRRSVTMGNACTSNNDDTVCIGYNSQCIIDFGVCVGKDSVSNGNSAITVGRANNATNTDAYCFGRGCTASGINTLAVGTRAISGAGQDNLAIGTDATCGAGGSCIAIGNTALCTAASGANLAIGNSVTVNGATGVYNSCIGFLSDVTSLGDQNISFGAGVTIAGDATADNNVAIGSNIAMTGNIANRIAIGQATACSAADGISMGRSANASAADAISVGRSSIASTANAVAIGQTSLASGTSCTAVGGIAVASSADCTAFGYNARARASKQTAIGLNANASAAGPNNTVVGADASVTNVNVGATNNVIIGQGAQVTGVTAGCTVIGQGAVGTVSNAVYFRTGLTTAAAAVNLHYDTVTGRVHPVTSSIRYKRDVQDFRDTSNILNVVPKTYAFRKGYCGCACECDEEGNTIECTEESCHRREVGFIAEDMELPELFPEICSYSKDENGNTRVESIQYDRLGLLLIPEVRKLRDRIAELERRLA